MFSTGDSQLVIYQIQGKYKVKKDHLKPLHREAIELLTHIPSHSLEYIPRERNGRADALSNLAMDRRQNQSKLIDTATASSSSTTTTIIEN